MIFYVGEHQPCHVGYLPSAFVSIRVLRRRRSDFKAQNWILDSGAFTELTMNGRYETSPEQYAAEINRWAKCGNLEMAVSQDYMCEPFVLDKTGLTVAEHQRLTIERYDRIKELVPAVPIMPVLQGYQHSEYIDHLKQYGDRLTYGMRVGVGSVCKRNGNPRQIAAVLEGIKKIRPDLRLHGFGLKLTALSNSYVSSLLYSADSMAWSYNARRTGGNSNGLEEALDFYTSITQRHGYKPHQLNYAMRGRLDD